MPQLWGVFHGFYPKFLMMQNLIPSFWPDYANFNDNIRLWIDLSVLSILAIIARFTAQWFLLKFIPMVRNHWEQAREKRERAEFESLAENTQKQTKKVFQNYAGWATIILHDHVLVRVAKIVPSLVIQLGIYWVSNMPDHFEKMVVNLATAFTTWHIMRAITCIFDEMNAAHDRHDGPKLTQTNSITSYVQLGKLIAWIFGGLLIIAALLDKSPLLLLSGMGAMSAILMLVFKDTILSFVAGIQISTNDMLRVGDWMEMPQTGADGFVVEIGLNTVKVQNWDKTMTTIPTWRLMTDSFKNWRSMFESGGRRIMRNLLIDSSTVQLLDSVQREKMEHIALLNGWWDRQKGLLAQPELAAKNMPIQAIAAHNVTNLSAFKAYTQAYLLAHPRIHDPKDMLLIVRTLEPTALGVPLQIYAFTNTTAWVEYESIQGEIMEHLMGVLPEFGLRLYQRSSDKI